MQAEINESAGVLAPLYSTVRSRDMLFVIMEQRKNAEKCNRFVQHITCAPESMAILCTNQQLLDVEIFCCDSYSFTNILGVDPTFNLGEFSVTPTVFHNVLLEDHKTHRLLLVVGPMLVHYRKQFCLYHHFFQLLLDCIQLFVVFKRLVRMGRRHLLRLCLKTFLVLLKFDAFVTYSRM